MKILDKDIAVLVNSLYEYPNIPKIEWLYKGTDGGVFWAIKRIDDIDIVVFRGSTTLEDWVRDFEAVADPLEDDDIGPVHPGFNEGMLEVFDKLSDISRGQNVIVTGHSLGAGRASILTGYMVYHRCPPLSRVVFGEPRPGFQHLADLVQTVPGRSYRNGCGTGLDYDLVTALPLNVWPEEYVHPTRMVDVTGSPPADDPWSLFRWHHMPLYVKALQNITTAT